MRQAKIMALLIVSVVLLGCAPGESSSLEEVTLKLKWLHQAQFAGNYVAAENGFYEREGLSVEIVSFSFEEPTIQAVVEGQADFGITSANELLLAREEGASLRAIATIFQITPDAAYSLKESGIEGPYDFVGKRVGVKETSSKFYYSLMLDKLGIDRSTINEVPIGFGADELIVGKTDVSLGYAINEPHLAIEEGYEVNIILFAEYGVNAYADVIFTTEQMIQENPETVEGFLRATLDGWQYAIENIDEAVAVTLEYAPDASQSHELFMLERSIPLINTGEGHVGSMDMEGWENVAHLLYEGDIIDKKIDVSGAFTQYFVERIYG